MLAAKASKARYLTKLKNS